MIKSYLLSYGYKEEEIDSILNNPNNESLSEEIFFHCLGQNIVEFEILGLSKKRIIEITAREPDLLCVPYKVLARRIKCLTDLGFTDREALKIIKSYPKILTLDLELLEDKFASLESYGFSRNMLLAMAKKFPVFLSLTSVYLYSKFDDFESFGFTPVDIVQMSSKIPQVLLVNANTIEERIKFLSTYLEKSEVISLCVAFPNLFRNMASHFEKKFAYLMSLGLKNFILEHPHYLGQSYQLTKARYRYLMSKNHPSEAINGKILFLSSSQFESIYGVSKGELLDFINSKGAHEQWTY